MTNLTFKQLRDAIQERQKEWASPDGLLGLLYRALEVTTEAGEAGEAVKKFFRAQTNMIGSKATKEDVAQEIADVIIAADLLAQSLDLDLGEEIIKKFNATSRKYGLTTKL